MSDVGEKKCPDCGGSMSAIKIVDKTVQTIDFSLKFIGFNFPQHTTLEYTVPEAKRSFWTSTFPLEGAITAYMCDSCGRITLYGQPKEGVEPSLGSAGAAENQKRRESN